MSPDALRKTIVDAIGGCTILLDIFYCQPIYVGDGCVEYECMKLKLKQSFAIGAAVVASFGYRKDMDGQWVRKQDLPPTAPNERTPSPPPQRSPFSSLLNDVLHELRDFRAFVGDRFDAMDSHRLSNNNDVGKIFFILLEFSSKGLIELNANFGRSLDEILTQTNETKIC
ncbi:hypothetical protein HKD37_15G044026 [Glycine soja]